jgi:hypothetical protein
MAELEFPVGSDDGVAIGVGVVMAGDAVVAGIGVEGAGYVAELASAGRESLLMD